MSSGLRSCRVCGNSSFQEDDGFSFCEECGTQAEAAPREEATDDMVFGGAGKWTAVERRRVVTTLGAPQRIVARKPEFKSRSLRDEERKDMLLMREKPVIRASADATGDPAVKKYIGRSYYDDVVPLHSDGIGRADKLSDSDSDMSGKEGESQQSSEPTWTLLDGLQVILRAQVDALVCAGYPSELEDVVGQLWFLYLRNAGLAFTDDAAKEEAVHQSFHEEIVKKYSVFMKGLKAGARKKKLKRKRQQEVQLQHESTPDNAVQSPSNGSVPLASSDPPGPEAVDDLLLSCLVSVSPQRKRTRKGLTVCFEETPYVCSSPESTTSHSASDDSGAMSDYLEQRLQDGLETVSSPDDAPGDDSASSRASSDDDDEEDVDHEARCQEFPGAFCRPVWPTRRIDINLPRPLHLLALNLLALLSLGEPVVASDIVNFVMQGWLPYLSLDHILDEHMSLWQSQHLFFRPKKCPSRRTLYVTCHELAAVLELPLPPIDAESVICRFLRDLLFPAHLTKCARQLLLLAPLPHHSVVSGKTMQRAWRDIDFDLCCMASVVVLVKLAYGLNDDVEWRQVEHSAEIEWNTTTQSPVTEEHSDYIPVWQEWLKMYRDQLRGSLSTPSMRRHGNTTHIIRSCDALLKERRGVVLMTHPSGYNRRHVYALRRDARNVYRHMFLPAAGCDALSSFYAPRIPLCSASEKQTGKEGSGVVQMVHAFPFHHSLADDTSDAETADEAPSKPRALFTGKNYPYYKPSAQLHCQVSAALLTDICSSHINCGVKALRRQVQQVEARLFKASSPRLIANLKSEVSAAVALPSDGAATELA